MSLVDFLGIKKFGQGVASAGRVFSGAFGQDIANQQKADLANQKVLYAAKQEKDPIKKKRLLDFVQKQQGLGIQSNQIDPGLNLTNKEVLGSAANVVLNIATPGAFKGGKLAVVGKNAVLGSAFGAASGLEKNRSNKGIIGSTLGGALVGAGVGATGLLAKAAKDFLGQKTPEWIMNKAVKPALQDLKKNVKYGTDTLGKELLDLGVKGGPKKLLEIANDRQTMLEEELQGVLTHPNFSNVKIGRDQVAKYIKDLITHKRNVPGLSGDVQRIEAVVKAIPEKMSLVEANQMKRSIYQELRDVAYKLDAKLGTRAAALKQIAKGLKTEIENATGDDIVRGINKKLSIYGRLENSMVDQLARNMRNNGIGLTDAILLAGGDTTSILAILRHLGQGTETYAAQGLKQISKLGEGAISKAVKGVTKKAAFNIP